MVRFPTGESVEVDTEAQTVLYLMGARPGHDADYSPTSSAEVKNEWSFTFVSPICLQSVYRDNFHTKFR